MLKLIRVEFIFKISFFSRILSMFAIGSFLSAYTHRPSTHEVFQTYTKTLLTYEVAVAFLWKIRTAITYCLMIKKGCEKGFCFPQFQKWRPFFETALLKFEAQKKEDKNCTLKKGPVTLDTPCAWNIDLLRRQRDWNKNVQS